MPLEQPDVLRLSVAEGRAFNEFYRRGPVAAHLVLTSGTSPRLVVVFPAGNSGTAIWFDAPAGLAWNSGARLEAAQRRLTDGTVLHGITADLTATSGPMTVEQAIASSVRVIRDYEYTGDAPHEVLVQPRVSNTSATWERRRLDGSAGYYLSVEMRGGSIAPRESGSIAFLPDSKGVVRMRVTALTGDPPLTPIPRGELLTAAASDARLEDILAFLSYEQKLLAGSWRFNTYFGRDTLMSLRLLAPILQPRVMEAGLGAVLERLNDAGEVAHEEDINEFAILRRLRAGLPPSAEPLYDYKMIDDDFMLPVVAAHYLLETPAGRERSAQWLARRTGGGESHGARLARNLRFVVHAASSFAREPGWRHLIALKPGEQAGNWRDSQEGLGGGRYPYDVNGVFVPAALDAIARLHGSGMLRSYIDAGTDQMLAQAALMADTWQREAPRLFDVSLDPASAKQEVLSYSRRLGIDASAPSAALAGQPLQFRAVALDGAGRPIRILNSDEGFALLLLRPDSAELQRIAEVLTRPFPAGLLTEVGLLVANPAYAPDELEPLFDRGRYHGTVIWSWQQAVLAAGIERQLARTDLTSPARDALLRARVRIRAAIGSADSMRGSELWSWSQRDGRYRIESFGQRDVDETESNAAQLWSTVHLARPPQ